MTSTDVEAFVAYRSDPEVARYQSWSDYTLERGRALIDSMLGAAPGVPGQWHPFALELRAGSALIGDLALKVNGGEPTEAELGITLAPEHQGNGYGTEAVRGLLGYGFVGGEGASATWAAAPEFTTSFTTSGDDHSPHPAVP